MALDELKRRVNAINSLLKKTNWEVDEATVEFTRVKSELERIKGDIDRKIEELNRLVSQKLSALERSDIDPSSLEMMNRFQNLLISTLDELKVKYEQQERIVEDKKKYLLSLRHKKKSIGDKHFDLYVELQNEEIKKLEGAIEDIYLVSNFFMSSNEKH